MNIKFCWDPNVGKLWYRSRHYDAAMGRFGQADKWGKSVMNPVGYHSYGYVRGNPVRWVDPFGWVNMAFFLGYYSKATKAAKTNDLIDYVYRNVFSAEDIFKTIANSKQQIDNLVILSHGATDNSVKVLDYMVGHEKINVNGDTRFKEDTNTKLTLADWKKFSEKYSDGLSNNLSKDLTLELRACNSGKGDYLNEVKKYMNAETAIGYTASLADTPKGAPITWGVVLDKLVRRNDAWFWTPESMLFNSKKRIIENCK